MPLNSIALFKFGINISNSKYRFVLGFIINDLSLLIIFILGYFSWINSDISVSAFDDLFNALQIGHRLPVLNAL